MILAILAILIVGGVTYFHYVEGGFTSAMSAFSAIIAALVAFAYYEQVVVALEPGKMIDFSLGMALILLFGISYLVLRILFDSVVPGNIRLPLYVDRGCAAGFGLVAGMICAGVFSVGAQLLPFSVSLMPARYELQERTGVILPRNAVQNGRQDQDVEIHNELAKETFDPADRKGMLLPVDDLVLGIVGNASSSSFAGDLSFNEIHPDLMSEAFANRLGPDAGIKRIVLNGGKTKQVSVADDKGLSYLPAMPKSADSEIPALRPDKKPFAIKKDDSKQLLVVTAKFTEGAADTDGYVRIPTAAVRLVIDGKTFYPVGTMDKSSVLALAKMDDFIILSKNGTKGADFVFRVDVPVIKGAVNDNKFKDPKAFFEVKLLGRVPLAGKSVNAVWLPSDVGGAMYKKMSPLISPDSDKKN